MSEEEIDRKITVIFATDVVGYSKHMEADESGTVKNLRACEKLLTGLFKKHKGRLFNTGGDHPLSSTQSCDKRVLRKWSVDISNHRISFQKRL